MAELPGQFAAMIAKCANPACSAPFHYLREGKLFRMGFDPERSTPGQQLGGDPRPVRKIEYFWLCESCSATLTLVMKEGKVEAAPIEPDAIKRAAAS